MIYMTIAVIVLVFFVLKALFRVAFKKKCPACKERIPKSASICSKCRTPQENMGARETPSLNKASAEFIRKLPSLIVSNKLIHKLLPGKVELLIYLLLLGSFYYLSEPVEDWYMRTVEADFIEHNRLPLIPMLESEIGNVFTPIARVYKDDIEPVAAFVGYGIKDEYGFRIGDISATVDMLENSFGETVTLGIWGDRSQSMPHIHAFPRRFVNDLINQDPFLLNLGNRHPFIMFMRGQIGNRFSCAFLGNSEWNPYSQAEYSGESSCGVSRYALFRHFYGKDIAFRMVPIRQAVEADRISAANKRIIWKAGKQNELADYSLSSSSFVRGPMIRPFSKVFADPDTKAGIRKLWNKNAVIFADKVLMYGLIGSIIIIRLFCFLVSLLFSFARAESRVKQSAPA